MMTEWTSMVKEAWNTRWIRSCSTVSAVGVAAYIAWRVQKIPDIFPWECVVWPAIGLVFALIGSLIGFLFLDAAMGSRVVQRERLELRSRCLAVFSTMTKESLAVLRVMHDERWVWISCTCDADSVRDLVRLGILHRLESVSADHVVFQMTTDFQEFFDVFGDDVLETAVPDIAYQEVRRFVVDGGDTALVARPS